MKENEVREERVRRNIFVRVLSYYEHRRRAWRVNPVISPGSSGGTFILSLCLEYVEAGIDFRFASRLESCDSLTSATLLRRAGATPSLWSLLSSLICRGRRVPLRVRVIDCDERDVGLFLALPPRGCLVIRSNSSLGLIVFCSMCRLWVGMLQGMEIRFIELEI